MYAWHNVSKAHSWCTLDMTSLKHDFLNTINRCTFMTFLRSTVYACLTLLQDNGNLTWLLKGPQSMYIWHDLSNSKIVCTFTWLLPALHYSWWAFDLTSSRLTIDKYLTWILLGHQLMYIWCDYSKSDSCYRFNMTSQGQQLLHNNNSHVTRTKPHVPLHNYLTQQSIPGFLNQAPCLHDHQLTHPTTDENNTGNRGLSGQEFPDSVPWNGNWERPFGILLLATMIQSKWPKELIRQVTRGIHQRQHQTLG